MVVVVVLTVVVVVVVPFISPEVVGRPPLVEGVGEEVGVALGVGVGSALASGAMSQLLGMPEGEGEGSEIVGIKPLPRIAKITIPITRMAARPTRNDFIWPI